MRMAEGKFGPIFVVLLAATGITLAGLCACGIGVLFAWPLVILITTCAYADAEGSEPPLSRPAGPRDQYDDRRDDFDRRDDYDRRRDN
jgi:hypothetical protein